MAVDNWWHVQTDTWPVRSGELLSAAQVNCSTVDVQVNLRGPVCVTEEIGMLLTNLYGQKVIHLPWDLGVCF